MTTTMAQANAPLDRSAGSLDAMLDEAIDYLNQREYGEALKVFRQYFALRNVWRCVECGKESSGYEILRGCPTCGGEMETRVVRGKANAQISGGTPSAESDCSAPPGYSILRPSEEDVWRRGDLVRGLSGAWEPADYWLGVPIRGIGARPNALLQQLSAPVPVSVGKVLYEFAVYDAETDEPQAGGAAPTLEEAEREGRHYFAMYSEDGPMRLELRRVEEIPAHALPVPEVTP